MKLEEYAVSVNEVNKYIKQLIDGDESLSNLVIKGELSNFKKHYTGHIYFTLKDEESLIKCICFKTYANELKEELKDGDKVCVVGSVSVFPRDGVYQVYVKNIEKSGVGNLYQKFVELKEKLSKEGIFDQTNKKEIPKFPKSIGVLTSQTGSVIRDIINVSTRRNPNVNIKLLPVPVQGPDAYLKIIDGIKTFNKFENVDVIILARGGGSLEDLWPFNEEDLAYQIYESKIPIISAVGHETDFTIADFASDLRAPTPSAAAELAVPNILDIQGKIEDLKRQLKNSLLKKVELMDLKYKRVINSTIFKNPEKIIEEKTIYLTSLEERLLNNINTYILNSNTIYKQLSAKLETLSPMKTLERGYSIVYQGGEVIKNISQVDKDNNLKIQVNDGTIISKIESVDKNKE